MPWPRGDQARQPIRAPPFGQELAESQATRDAAQAGPGDPGVWGAELATETWHGERGKPEKRQQQAFGAKKSISSLPSCLISP